MLCQSSVAELVQNLVLATALPCLKIISVITKDALVHLDVDINVANEFQRRGKRDGSQHEEEDVAGEERVSKELNGLQCTRHV